MEEKETLQSVSDAMLEKPLTFEVDILNPTLKERLFIRAGGMKAKRTFIVKPPQLSKLLRISKVVIGIDFDIFNESDTLGSTYNLVVNHAEQLAFIIAVAVSNPRETDFKKLTKFFLDNLTSAELLQAATLVLKQMDLQSFLLTIISLKGVNILEKKRANVTTVKEREVSL